MSWSITVIGKPAKVSAKLDEYGATLTGASKDEFDAAKPHLKALVEENVNTNDDTNYLVKLTASGHAYLVGGEKMTGNCFVSLEQLYAQLAL